MQRGKKVWTTSAAKTITYTDFSFHTILVYSICDKNQAQKKLETKNTLWRSTLKFSVVFAIFLAFSRLSGDFSVILQKS